ncbi:MAG: 16S rRNA (guanine(966)-N(2))-methyltransferase RsmD [Ignavibacteriae bacterium]|nr:MAG: 16S rRNA (guanine(966)-N(2))-methyltransferase RsmD [Ignavibacteriota bacterium]
MRIIAGEFRGRSIESVRDLSVRPTTDRAKQTIFDILTNRIEFDGLEVLDLFAGSGSLGLESISRGVKNVTFIDKARKSLDVLEKNVAALGCEPQCSVYQADVFWYLKNIHRPYDLVFTDPPYKLENIGLLPNAIYDSGVLHNGTYVVMEHSRESVIDLDERKYEILRKPFGQTTVLIMQAIVPPTPPRT